MSFSEFKFAWGQGLYFSVHNLYGMIRTYLYMEMGFNKCFPDDKHLQI